MLESHSFLLPHKVGSLGKGLAYECKGEDKVGEPWMFFPGGGNNEK